MTGLQMYGCIPSLSHTPQLKTGKTMVAEKEGKPDPIPTLQLIPENKWFQGKYEYVSKFVACISLEKKKNVLQL
jgi:hypothetical protein